LKNKYKRPDLEIINLKATDLIATSQTQKENFGEGNNEDPSGWAS